MKKAFSFIELIFCIIILSFIFISLHLVYIQIYKNYEFLSFFQRLYNLEEKLYDNPKVKNILINTSNLGSLNLLEEYESDGLFELKKINIKDKNYTSYFQ
ncbi:hypothetical protein JG677_06790 [Campylobacter sp. TTU-622]|uniref:hypothetical protein n=1 Tax=unclassified Campylobacter TaxID=2593542 RepID=UPI0019072720|nr:MULTISPECIES: hypothetical protein [unclassified Campylobacter]MBK1971639.1 hypothetical protein [Campylobacter sp. TTU_617]MBK1973751.1 hypothetical protein [Campylobacter sp. TTU-622]